MVFPEKIRSDRVQVNYTVRVIIPSKGYRKLGTCQVSPPLPCSAGERVTVSLDGLISDSYNEYAHFNYHSDYNTKCSDPAVIGGRREKQDGTAHAEQHG